MKIGKNIFNLENEPVIMGILNVTPDSFSDGGKWNCMDAAFTHTEQMIKEGAKIIDIGGESTRPGYSYKTKVAEAGIAAGADMINDIWGLKWGKQDMAALVAETGVAVCIMHNKDNTTYNEYVKDVLADLKESIAIAHKAKIKDSQIVLDPGVGFGKNYQQNLTIIQQVDRLKELGYPILLGTSRKSVIGLTLDADIDDRIAGTVATTVMGYERGCRIFRVHDVKENYQALMMAKAIMDAGE